MYICTDTQANKQVDIVHLIVHLQSALSNGVGKPCQYFTKVFYLHFTRYLTKMKCTTSTDYTSQDTCRY